MYCQRCRRREADNQGGVEEVFHRVGGNGTERRDPGAATSPTVTAPTCGSGSVGTPGSFPGSGGFCARRPTFFSCSTPFLWWRARASAIFTESSWCLRKVQLALPAPPRDVPSESSHRHGQPPQGCLECSWKASVCVSTTPQTPNVDTELEKKRTHEIWHHMGSNVVVGNHTVRANLGWNQKTRPILRSG